MLLRLRPSLPKADLDSILLLCKELGYRSRFIDGRRELLELSGDGEPSHRSRLVEPRGVVEILDRGDAWELNERTEGRPSTVVQAAGARFGGGSIAVIAGPCAVEDAGRLAEIAAGVRAHGATLLRGGAFKPRTSPYSFQGLGHKGLEILARTKERTGLGVVTEVLDPRDVGAVCEVADMLQIGARSMSNFPLLTEVGQTRKPVLLKRGFASTVREFLLAAEYILAGGNEQVVLCERGVRGFETVTRNMLDVGAVAHLKRATHLPVIVDPSHAAGRADLVRPLARAGVAAGADGLMIEVHSEPSAALSDGGQAISTDELGAIVADTRALATIDGRQLVTPGVTPASTNGVLS